MHIGEDSHFHQTYGYYAQGVNVEVAVLPSGWRERTTDLALTAARCRAVAPRPSWRGLSAARPADRRRRDRQRKAESPVSA